MDGARNVDSSDSGCIREIAPNGIITTFAGSGSGMFAGDGGPAVAAGINPVWSRNSPPPGRGRYHVRSIMKDNKWARLLAYIMGMVNQRLLLQYE